MKAKHLIENFVKCREIIINNIKTYISDFPNKTLTLTQKSIMSVLEEEKIIPLKIYVMDNNVFLEYYNKEEYEEFRKNALSYCDRLEDFSADEIYAILIIIEKTENDETMVN